MRVDEFNKQMKRLNEAYRDYYTSERMKIVWSIVSEIPKEYFEFKVGKALWADYPPKLDWFQELRRAYYSNKGSQELYQEGPHPSETSKLGQNKIRELINSIFQRKEET